MAIFSFDTQPALRVFSDANIEKIHESAVRILKDVGVQFYSTSALQILGDHGAEVDTKKQIAKFKETMIADSIEKAPETFNHYYINSNEFLTIGGDEVFYYPGSTAIRFMESDGKTIRTPKCIDYVRYCQLVKKLQFIDVNTSCLLLSDVPEDFVEIMKVYISLLFCDKPLITATFTKQNTNDVIDMIAAVSGGKEAMIERPCTTFIYCPSPPLSWAEVIVENVVKVASNGLPLIYVSMPTLGANAPATIAGCVAQHAVETLSGLALAQAISPGLPVVYGGTPVLFDMKTATTALGAMESYMMDVGINQMGKYYGLPVRATMTITDSKCFDTQTGWETGMGFLIGSLSRINLVSGAGMIESGRCQSLEKLVMDNEIAGMCKRFLRGVEVDEDRLAFQVISDLGPGGSFLGSKHTFEHFKKEQYIPSDVTDRKERFRWEKGGAKTSFDRARDMVEELLKDEPETVPCLKGDALKNLQDVFNEICKRRKITDVPILID